MTFLTSNARNIIAARRNVLIVTCALTLSGCQTDGNGSTAAGDAAARIQTAKPAEPARDAEPMTRSRAARECWMRTEKGNAHEDLDRRADLVNKCIDEKMKAAGAALPRT